MKQLHKYVLVAVLLIICFLITSFYLLFSESENISKNELSSETALQLYQQAANNTRKAGDIRMIVTKSIIRTIGEESFQESSSQIVSLDLSDPVNRCYHVYEELSFASNSVIIEDYYVDGNQYFTVSGAKFHVTRKEESFWETIPPIAMLDASLYTNISGIEHSDTYQIEFSDALKAESWLPTESVQLIKASGSSVISKDCRLLSGTYSISYRKNAIQYDIHYDTSLEAVSLEITPPTDMSSYLPLTEPESIRSLELAVGFLLQAKDISASYHEEIYIEALGDRRIRRISLTSEESDSLSAKMITETTTTNNSRPGWDEQSVTEETFKDQQYTIAHNGEAPSSNPAINADSVQQYLYNQLISTIMLPSYIDSCTKTDNGTVLRYEFSGNDAFADFLCRNAGQQLYQDPQLLQGKDIQTEHLVCHLEIDITTGLPHSSGISYTGNYKIEGLPYSFSYFAIQEYQFPKV